MRVLEVDEEQHFNVFRAETFKHYPGWAEVAFDVEEWRRLSANKTKLEGGGFAKANPCSRNSTGDTSSALFAMHCATYYHHFMVLLPRSGSVRSRRPPGSANRMRPSRWELCCVVGLRWLPERPPDTRAGAECDSARHRQSQCIRGAGRGGGAIRLNRDTNNPFPQVRRRIAAGGKSALRGRRRSHSEIVQRAALSPSTPQYGT